MNLLLYIQIVFKCNMFFQLKVIRFFRSTLTNPLTDMARVYNWDVKRRSKDNLLKSAERS